MLTWLRPLVDGKAEKLQYIVMILPKGLETIEQAGLPRPLERNIWQLARSMAHANTQHRSTFHGLSKNTKVSCLKIPRKTLPDDLLTELDKCLGHADKHAV